MLLEVIFYNILSLMMLYDKPNDCTKMNELHIIYFFPKSSQVLLLYKIHDFAFDLVKANKQAVFPS